MSPSHDILIVEDDLMLARALQRSLAAKAIAVRHVARCSAAAGLLGPYAVGVFDIELPDGDGVELARLMLRRGIVRRAVFHSACSHPARLASARDLGSVFIKSSHLSSLMDLLSPHARRDPSLSSSREPHQGGSMDAASLELRSGSPAAELTRLTASAG